MKSGLLRQALLLIALAFLPALGHAVYYRGQVSWNAAPVAKDEVKLEDVRAWGDSVLWVDARPTDQFEEAHIPGAMSLYLERWGDLLPPLLNAWSPEKRTVVYCGSQECELSHEVAKRLREEAGLKEVYVLHGGWEAWQEANK